MCLKISLNQQSQLIKLSKLERFRGHINACQLKSEAVVKYFLKQINILLSDLLWQFVSNIKLKLIHRSIKGQLVYLG